VVDVRSGSMINEQAWIKPTLSTLFQGLEAAGLDSGANIACSIGFVNTLNRDLGCAFFAGSDNYDDKFLDFVGSGGLEDGFSALDFGIDIAEDFIAANAVEIDEKCSAVIRTIVIVTDEDRDVVDSSITEAGLRATLTQGNWILNSILSISNFDIGTFSDGSTIILDSNDSQGYSTTAPGTVNPDELPVIGPEYADLAWDFGGVAWNLLRLRAGGAPAEAFGNAFVETKIDEIKDAITAAPTIVLPTTEPPTFATLAPSVF
ncbi:MAG: hypothetical protein AAF550_14740, partial [Myxococcota bacterium]